MSATKFDINNEEDFNKLLLRGLHKIREIAIKPSNAERILALRKLRGLKDKDVLRAFIHYALSNMIANSIWVGSRSEKRAGLMFSLQDEAYAILIMMNNWGVWERMVKGEKRDRGKSSDTLYTNKTVTINSVNLSLKGWTNEGMQEFNDILEYLSTVRNNEDTIEMENEIMNEYNDLDYIKSRKRKKRDHDDILLSERIRPFDGYNMVFEQV